jgi:hypothetical protein
MAKQTVNLGTMADNKSGDPLRTAFEKINENFDELYAQSGGTAGSLVKEGAATLEELDALQGTYQDSLVMLSDEFYQYNTEVGFPFGITLPLSYLTYDEFIEISAGLVADEVLTQQQAAVIANRAMSAKQAHLVYEEAVVAAEITSGDATLNFNNLGELVFPDGTKQTTAYINPTQTESPLPSWLIDVSTHHLPLINKDYGWNENGMWFTNHTIGGDDELVSYPVRYNDTIPANQGVVITADFVVNDLGADFGIGVWADGVDPIWQWAGVDSGGNRIGAQYNGPRPEIHARVGQGVSSEFNLPETVPATYRARLTISPPADGSITVTLETLDTMNNILDTISCQEEAFSTPYRIGFAADQDDGSNRTYVKNLIINVNGSIYADPLTTYNSGEQTSSITGAFQFVGHEVAIANGDMDIRTTRTDYDTDADIGLYSADDVWIEAEGDEIRMSAANSVRIVSCTLDMYPEVFDGRESQFVGTWNANELSITVPNGQSQLVSLLNYYTTSTNSIWIKTASGVAYTATNNNATATDGGSETVFVIPTAAASPSADAEVLSVKLFDSTINGNTNREWAFGRNGDLIFPRGSTVAEVPSSSETIQTGVVIQPSDLAGAIFNWTGQPVIESPNYTNAGWDYIGFNNPAWRASLFDQLGGSDGQLPVTWTAGSTELSGFVRVNFGEGDSFQFVPTDEFASNFVAGTWVFPATIGTTGTVTITTPAHTKLSVNGNDWKFSENGDTTLAGALVGDVTTVTYAGGTVDLDINATINKLTPVADYAQHYHLADGVEGQIMYITLASNGDVSNEYTILEFDHARYHNNAGYITEASAVGGWMPFRGMGTTLTLLFIDGHWNLPHNNFD